MQPHKSERAREETDRKRDRERETAFYNKKSAAVINREEAETEFNLIKSNEC